jgi:hypothetical protein
MSSFWNFIFGSILVIIWIIAGVYITQSNIYLEPYANTDGDLNRAYTFAYWAAFITWFLIALFIVLIILSVFGLIALFGSGVGEAGVAAEGVEGETILSRSQNYATSSDGQSTIRTGISWVTIGFLIFALILVGITGVLSVIVAVSITRSSNYKPSINKLKIAYDDSIIAASMCITAGALLVIGIVTYFAVGYTQQSKIDAIYKQEQSETAKIHQLKLQIIERKLEQLQQDSSQEES